ncbi:hypothetical protein D9M71_400100 [compost metagenome]
MEDQREHQEVGEGHAGVEQHDARHQQRQGDAFLVLVQAGGDEAPDLVQDHRHGEEQRHHHGQLERGEEGRGHVGGDHGRAFRQVLAQGRRDQGVDLLREVEQAGEDQEDRRYAAQQACTQFGEVRDQGHFLVLFRLLVAHGMRDGCCGSTGAWGAAGAAAVAAGDWVAAGAFAGAAGVAGLAGA